MTTHTKGPWKVNYHKNIVYQEPSQIPVAVVSSGTIESGYTIERIAANLELIAKAPGQQAVIDELVHACQQALSYRRQTHHGDDRCVALLEKAINKATT